MTTFHLTVVTPDGCAFDGQAERVVCRAIDGDLAILAKHGDYCTALGMGEAHIVDADGQRRRAACMGGMLTVLDGEVRLVATTWEWAEEIDQARAEASKKRAEEILAREEPRPPRVRDGTGPPQACPGAYLHPPVISERKAPGVSGGKRRALLRHSSAALAAASQRGPFGLPGGGGIAAAMTEEFTSCLPSRSGCGCGGPASRWRWCSRRRWAR